MTSSASTPSKKWFFLKNVSGTRIEPPVTSQTFQPSIQMPISKSTASKKTRAQCPSESMTPSSPSKQSFPKRVTLVGFTSRPRFGQARRTISFSTSAKSQNSKWSRKKWSEAVSFFTIVLLCRDYPDQWTQQAVLLEAFDRTDLGED